MGQVCSASDCHPILSRDECVAPRPLAEEDVATSAFGVCCRKHDGPFTSGPPTKQSMEMAASGRENDESNYRYSNEVDDEVEDLDDVWVVRSGGVAVKRVQTCLTEPASGNLQSSMLKRAGKTSTLDSLVTLRIYDVSTYNAVKTLNRVIRVFGTGAFHTAVEIYGMEWSYGYDEDDNLDGGTGVFGCVPGAHQRHIYRESLPMGNTALTEQKVESLLEDLQQEWLGRDYDLLHRNCCHFSDMFCQRLGVGDLPSWVTNLAGAGATIDEGFRQIGRPLVAVKSAAIIAAAKAGKVDDSFKIKGKVTARAFDMLQMTGHLDGKLAQGAQALGSKLGDLQDKAVKTLKTN